MRHASCLLQQALDGVELCLDQLLPRSMSRWEASWNRTSKAAVP